MMRTIFCLLLTFSLTYAKEMLPNGSYYLFATSTFTEMDSPISTCDSSAINDPHGEWLCAQASQDYAAFIRSWESIVALNPDMTALSNWKIFHDANGNITFYARAYSFQQTQLVASYAPAEIGREISIGVSPQISRIMAYSHNEINMNDIFPAAPVTSVTPATSVTPVASGDAATSHTPANPTTPDAAPNHTAPNRNDYNCSDFADQAAAIDFFNRHGFSASYDPYYLDANRNGIPCEDYDQAHEPRQQQASQEEPHQSETQCAAGESWVAPYTRSDGVQVRGHCRKDR